MRFALMLVAVGALGCTEEPTILELNEIAQQMGDSMASVDEAGGNNSGSFSLYREGGFRSYARLSPSTLGEKIQQLFVPQAQAASCFAVNTFSGCTNNVITRDFADCTILGATFSGTVTLTFDDGVVDSTCSFAGSGNSVSRSPNFTMTGRRDAVLTVAKTGTVGQKLTRTATANEFLFSNDGIRRTFAANGETLLDFTSATTADITITGSSRTTRTMDGGTLQVTNNLSDLVCSFSPSSLAWDSTCNCATSGSWAGSCSDGSTSTMTITGCATGDLTLGDTTEAVTFDRCFDI